MLQKQKSHGQGPRRVRFQNYLSARAKPRPADRGTSEGSVRRVRSAPPCQGNWKLTHQTQVFWHCFFLIQLSRRQISMHYQTDKLYRTAPGIPVNRDSDVVFLHVTTASFCKPTKRTLEDENALQLLVAYSLLILDDLLNKNWVFWRHVFIRNGN